MDIRRPLALLVVVATATLTACVPLPGSSIIIATCLGCIDSSASVSPPVEDAQDAQDAPAAVPDLPAALAAATAGAPDVSPGETQAQTDTDTDTNEAAPAATSPTHPRPAPPKGSPAAPEAGAGQDAAEPLTSRLREAEGLSLTPYEDIGGVEHICYGHRVTVETCDRLLDADIERHLSAAERVLGASQWAALSAPRQRVLAELAFMHGEAGLARFGEMLDALRAHDYERAADEMLDSVTAQRLPRRMWDLAEAMRTDGRP